ncbi:hypothetical protein [Pseudomonas sp. CGJS7]|uniref:hypothetical protein n=1 Tax=Pseudomonas sp. CGJS7 TaxID=3109348 RepID=UPI003008C13C
MNLHRRWTISAVALALLAVSAEAAANVGLPLLLTVNFIVFAVGGIAVVLVEWLAHIKLSGSRPGAALGDVFWANLLSTVVIGLPLPWLIAAASQIAAKHNDAAALVLAAGTWSFDGFPDPRLSLGFTFAYLALCFVLTVYFEAWVIARRWRRRGAQPARSARALSWIGNGLTYTGLLIFFVCEFAWPMLRANS